jgi:hypothetical protein
MLLKTAITGLAAAALVALTASATYAAASGGHGGAGNWVQEGTWNWPVTCKWVAVQVRPYNHKHPNWQWVKQCQ